MDLMNPTRSLEQLSTSREHFLNFVKSRVPSDIAAEDVLQTSLMKAVEHFNSLKDDDHLIPWFYQILRNTIADAYRRRSVVHEIELPAGFDVAEEQSVERRLCECFAELLPTLKVDYAELIESLDLRNEEASHAAQRLGITPNNLKVRHHRARQALKRGLEETCRVCAEHHCMDCTCKQSQV
jgi:RNA polymerase sigma factor (sigma-70 family)